MSRFLVLITLPRADHLDFQKLAGFRSRMLALSDLPGKCPIPSSLLLSLLGCARPGGVSAPKKTCEEGGGYGALNVFSHRMLHPRLAIMRIRCIIYYKITHVVYITLLDVCNV